MQLIVNPSPQWLPLFDQMKHHLSIAGVLTGAVCGQVWTNPQRSAAMLLSPQGFLMGGYPDDEFIRSINRLLKEELLPQRSNDGELDYVFFYPPAWAASMPGVLAGCDAMPDTRLILRHDFADVPLTLPDGGLPVDAQLLAREDLIGLDGVKQEILGGWPSLEDFCRRGFGWAVVDEKEEGSRILSWCLTDWVVGDACELGVETDEEFRLQGNGKKAVLGALALAKQHGLAYAGWHCWQSNEGSKGLAKSCGFTQVAQFEVYFGWNHPLDNALINGNYYMKDHPDVGVERDEARAAAGYARALDQGWDWGGRAWLYYNAACLHYRAGEIHRARQWMHTALEKGFDAAQQSKNPYLYRGEDAKQIMQELMQ